MVRGKDGRKKREDSLYILESTIKDLNLITPIEACKEI
jgi:hypothetical protein